MFTNRSWVTSTFCHWYKNIVCTKTCRLLTSVSKIYLTFMHHGQELTFSNGDKDVERKLGITTWERIIPGYKVTCKKYSLFPLHSVDCWAAWPPDHRPCLWGHARRTGWMSSPWRPQWSSLTTVSDTTRAEKQASPVHTRKRDFFNWYGTYLNESSYTHFRMTCDNCYRSFFMDILYMSK